MSGLDVSQYATSFDFYDETPVETPREKWLGILDHLSPTSLGMFRRCPRQFYRRYILGEKERPGEALVIGSFMHRALEFNYRQKIESWEDKPLSEVIEYLEDAAVPKVMEEAGGAGEVRWDYETDPTKALDHARSDAVRITSAYHHTVVPRIQPALVEEKFEWWPESLPVPIIGYLDTVTVDARIVDTKSGKQVQRKIKPSWQLQGVTYANAKVMPIEFHSVSRAKTPSICTPLESEEMVVYPNPRQAGNLLRLVHLVLDQIAFYMSTYGPEVEWPATGRMADWSQNVLPCQMCGWRSGCPAWEGEPT